MNKKKYIVIELLKDNPTELVRLLEEAYQDGYNDCKEEFMRAEIPSDNSNINFTLPTLLNVTDIML